MRIVSLALAAALTAACATIGFQPYADSGKVYEGSGGVKLEVDGVEIWSEGTPPRSYSVVGVVAQQGSGVTGDETALRAAVARTVKERGADAAIQVHGNFSFKGVVQPAQDISAGTGIRRLQYAIIRYVR
jgi:hypothetical protein